MSAKDKDGGGAADGYWWLAFDWRNLRICGNAGNRMKGTYFPLQDGCVRVTGTDDDLRYEVPFLLDPADDDDPNLLSFNMEGKAIPAAGITDWDRARVEYSVERCKLDFGPLEDSRKLVWHECCTHIEEFRREMAQLERNTRNVLAQQKAKNAVKRIRALIYEREAGVFGCRAGVCGIERRCSCEKLAEGRLNL